MIKKKRGSVGQTRFETAKMWFGLNVVSPSNSIINGLNPQNSQIPSRKYKHEATLSIRRIFPNKKTTRTLLKTNVLFNFIQSKFILIKLNLKYKYNKSWTYHRYALVQTAS